MEQILNKIYENIEAYESGSWQSADNLRVLLRELSCNHTWLTKYNIEAFRDWNMEVYKFKGSNAAAKVFADIKVPELRDTRKLLTAINIVINSMRSEIGLLRQEQ